MISVTKLLEITGGKLIGKKSGHAGFRQANSLGHAQADSLIWIKAGKKNAQKIINETDSKTIIVSANASLSPAADQVLIAVENPRLAFIKALQAFFVEASKAGVHPTAWIHPEASVDPNAYIGPFTSVGRATVGAGTVIHSNVSIYDGVSIGANVIIHSGAVIGADGFGFERDVDGCVFKFPHVGGVLIEDDVEIGANTCIDRGALDDTIIRQNAKVDNLVHIAHNVEVGARAFVIAQAMVAGSVKIGEGAWIAPCSAIMNGKSVGADALVGMSALVVKDVPVGEVWTGVPARPLPAYKALQRELKRLIEPEQ